MDKPKIILGIETSCDETSAAVMQKDDDGVKILSNIVASSADLQAKYGGVIPEQAAREQLRSIIPVIQEALFLAFPNVIPANAGIQLENSRSELDPRLRGDDRIKKIDAIAVTQGPGLIGSLLVGVETAKVLSTLWQKPLVPVNHLLGHFYANWISPVIPESKASRESINTNKLLDPRLRGDDKYKSPRFPLIGLLVSGGHTDLIYMTDHGQYQYLGGTRDDAAGEAFDKTARLLGLPYPGGPVISKLAESGNPKAFKLPRPMTNSGDFDFSFSGLKTAVTNLVSSSQFVVRRLEKSTNHQQITNDLAASIEAAIVDILIKKTIAAAQEYNVDQIIVAGGVAANQKLAEKLIAAAQIKIPRAVVFIPPPRLCTDNAAYIATAAFFNYQPINPLNLQASPNLSLS